MALIIYCSCPATCEHSGWSTLNLKAHRFSHYYTIMQSTSTLSLLEGLLDNSYAISTMRENHELVILLIMCGIYIL